MRDIKRLYKDPAKAAKLEAGFRSASKTTRLTAAALDALLQRPVAEVQLADVRDLLDTMYPQLIQGLQSAHTSTQAAGREEQRKRGPTEPRRYTKDQLEWTISAATELILAEKELARQAADKRGERLTPKQRNHFARHVLKSTRNDAAAWVGARVHELKKSEDDPKQFHETWNNLERRGRWRAASRGRFFQAPDAPVASTLGEEADGWGSYTATEEERLMDDWEPLPSTVGEEIEVEIILKVLAKTQENRTPGVDGTPITLFLNSPSAKAILIKMIQIMWKYELMPRDLPIVLQLMELVHTPVLCSARRL